MDLPPSFAYEYEQNFYPRRTGGKTRYLWIQPKTNLQHTLILFSHGMGFDAVYPHLHFFHHALKLGYEIFSYDIDGHGASSTTTLDANHLDTCLLDALGFVLQRTSTNICLTGMSLGGRVTLSTLEKPLSPQIQRGVLLATPLRGPSYFKSILYEPLTLLSRSFHKQWSDYGLTTIPTFGPFGRHHFPVRCRQKNYVAESIQYVNSGNPVDIAKKCTLPFHMRYGSWDGIAPPSHGYELQNAFPKSSLEIIQATHLGFPAKAHID